MATEACNTIHKAKAPSKLLTMIMCQMKNLYPMPDRCCINNASNLDCTVINTSECTVRAKDRMYSDAEQRLWGIHCMWLHYQCWQWWWWCMLHCLLRRYLWHSSKMVFMHPKISKRKQEKWTHFILGLESSFSASITKKDNDIWCWFVETRLEGNLKCSNILEDGIGKLTSLWWWCVRCHPQYWLIKYWTCSLFFVAWQKWQRISRLHPFLIADTLIHRYS